MITGTLLFVAGVLALQWQAVLPSIWWVTSLPILLYLIYQFPRSRPALAMWLGFVWALLYAHLILDHGLAAELEGKNLYLEGVVISIPERTPERTRFELQVEKLHLNATEYPSPGRIRLGWYRHAPKIQAGERWGLMVRLKRPHGFINPGGFDYEGWLFQRGIRATGYVRASERNRLLGQAGGLANIQRWRQHIRDQINALSPDAAGAALLNALVIGDRAGIERQHWQLFTNTGTSHLIAISGLHIGIIAGLAFFLMRRLWIYSETATLLLPAPHAATIAALIAAAIYAVMAGFAIPTQRALIMLMVFSLGFLLRRPPRPERVLALALLLVVIWDPLVVLSAGFWLSFSAVAAILYGFVGRLGKIGWIRQWGRVQWLVAMALAPVLLALSLQVSLLAPLVNLIAVPLFSFLVVPLALLSVALLCLYVPLAVLVLEFVGWLLVTGMSGLGYISEIPFTTWSGAELPIWVWLPAFLGVLLLLSPPAVPARWLGVVFLAPLLSLRPVLPAHGAAQITVLDVGQGLAVVVRTRHHALVYDLGPRFSAGFDAGSAVVLPFLRQAGVDRVDLLILSNGDMDHQGGLSGLLDQVEIGSVLSGEPQRIEVKAELCRAGQNWSWDGVRFRMLHPKQHEKWSGNNASCVLQMEVAGRLVLVPGDIHAEVERYLVAENSDLLKSDLVVIPHHGSKSSSSSGFTRAVSPSYAVVSTGYRNRYGFPNPDVLARWQGTGAEVLNTAELGAIEVSVGADGVITPPVSYRQHRQRYWQRQFIQVK
ncbi:MAG: DNA internalization-related competence protein ComEC/Rec2 [Gammaproteobacteria bacterium]|nr:DNA internalization-related competence protein ComEC/Rec2 [Gammaproteobacteria bacterium]